MLGFASSPQPTFRLRLFDDTPAPSRARESPYFITPGKSDCQRTLAGFLGMLAVPGAAVCSAAVA